MNRHLGLQPLLGGWWLTVAALATPVSQAQTSLPLNRVIAPAAVVAAHQAGARTSANANAAARRPGQSQVPRQGPAAAGGVAKPGTTPAERARSAARKATAAAGAAGVATAAATALTSADDDQRHAYTLTHLGEYECEFKRAVRVLAHPAHEGYVDMHFDKRVVTARPVLSSTGAIRLEDVRGRYLMVQIAFKSMLLDTRSGQRVADECLHDKHHEARAAAAVAPAPPGLGISATPTPPSSAAEASPAPTTTR